MWQSRVVFHEKSKMGLKNDGIIFNLSNFFGINGIVHLYKFYLWYGITCYMVWFGEDFPLVLENFFFLGHICKTRDNYGARKKYNIISGTFRLDPDNPPPLSHPANIETNASLNKTKKKYIS